MAWHRLAQPTFFMPRQTLGTSACPPYHVALVIGGTSAFSSEVWHFLYMKCAAFQGFATAFGVRSTSQMEFIVQLTWLSLGGLKRSLHSALLARADTPGRSLLEDS